MVIYGFRSLFFHLDRLGHCHNEDIERLSSSDWDVLCSFDELKSLINSFKKNEIEEIIPLTGLKYIIKTSHGNYDIHIIDNKENSNLDLYSTFNTCKNIITDKFGNKFHVVDLDYLFAIKKSHRFIKKGFTKTMKDYYRLLDLGKLDYININIEFKPQLLLFYDKRREEGLVRANLQTRHINLNQDKAGFFNTKGVTYELDHDSIHESVKISNVPAYKKMIADGEEVLCSKEKFETLTYSEKLHSVLEESYVIAIERYLFKGILDDPKESFLLALEKVCTTLTKGWFRQFAYENYREVISLYTEEFWEKFLKDLEHGEIKEHTTPN